MTSTASCPTLPTDTAGSTTVWPDRSGGDTVLSSSMSATLERRHRVEGGRKGFIDSVHKETRGLMTRIFHMY